MKKAHRLILVIAFLICSDSIYSQTVDHALAQKVATTKIRSLNCSDNFHLRPDPELFYDQSENPLFFAFQLEPQGYIIVSANQQLPPVVAYSFTSNYKLDESGSGKLLDLIQNDLTNRLLHIKLISEKIRNSRKLLWDKLFANELVKNPLFEQWPPAGTTSTGGWLETNWAQGAPYNKFVPLDTITNLRSVAGCPSIALAMIINYYETINETAFNDAEDDYHHMYAGRNFWVDDDFKDWDFLPFPTINAYFDTISNSYLNQLALKTDEKAALIWACGVAARQVYTSSISGTFGVDQAYEAILRFGFSESVLLDENDTTILTHFAQNMMQARPALLAVVDPGVAGHNLVTDGYNTDGYFHLNFGWGGSYNGWYLLPDEIPYNLTVFEGVIVDIAFPPVNTAVHLPVAAVSALNVYPNPTNSNFTIEWNMESQSAILLELFDLRGHSCFQKQMSGLTQGKNSISIGNQKDSSTKLLPGVYFCRIRTDEGSMVKKIILR